MIDLQLKLVKNSLVQCLLYFRDSRNEMKPLARVCLITLILSIVLYDKYRFNLMRPDHKNNSNSNSNSNCNCNCNNSSSSSSSSSNSSTP